MHVHSNKREKLDPKTVKYVFLGYSTTQKGYKCFHPSKKFFVSRDVILNEQESYFQPHIQGENAREEDESLMLPNIAVGLEIERGIKQTPEPAVGLEQAPKPAIEPVHNGGGKFGKNIAYSRKENVIPKSINARNQTT